MNYKAMNTNNGSRLSFVPAHFAAGFSERYPQSWCLGYIVISGSYSLYPGRTCATHWI